jgi:hypothetical protein
VRRGERPIREVIAETISTNPTPPRRKDSESAKKAPKESSRRNSTAPTRLNTSFKLLNLGVSSQPDCQMESRKGFNPQPVTSRMIPAINMMNPLS